MLASGTKLAADRGATNRDFCHEGMDTFAAWKDLLRWISQGRTIGEIALLEGKSVTEIEGYLQRALATLEAGSTEEALD